MACCHFAHESNEAHRVSPNKKSSKTSRYIVVSGLHLYYVAGENRKYVVQTDSWIDRSIYISMEMERYVYFNYFRNSACVVLQNNTIQLGCSDHVYNHCICNICLRFGFLGRVTT